MSLLFLTVHLHLKYCFQKQPQAWPNKPGLDENSSAVRSTADHVFETHPAASGCVLHAAASAETRATSVCQPVKVCFLSINQPGASVVFSTAASRKQTVWKRRGCRDEPADKTTHHQTLSENKLLLKLDFILFSFKIFWHKNRHEQKHNSHQNQNNHQLSSEPCWLLHMIHFSMSELQTKPNTVNPESLLGHSAWKEFTESQQLHRKSSGSNEGNVTEEGEHMDQLRGDALWWQQSWHHHTH